MIAARLIGATAPKEVRSSGRSLSAVEGVAAAPNARRAGLAAPRPDANRVAHESIREQMKQGGTGWDRGTAKLLLGYTTTDLRLPGEKALERLRA